jgi:hypothetical protein
MAILIMRWKTAHEAGIISEAQHNTTENWNNQNWERWISESGENKKRYKINERLDFITILFRILFPWGRGVQLMSSEPKTLSLFTPQNGKSDTRINPHNNWILQSKG